MFVIHSVRGGYGCYDPLEGWIFVQSIRQANTYATRYEAEDAAARHFAGCPVEIVEY